MSSNSFASASHKIFKFGFTGRDETTHDGSNEYGKSGTGRLLLKPLIENDLKNIHWWSFEVVIGGTAAKSDLDTSNVSMKSN